MKRKAWVAILFSILAPGLGQIYCGHLIRGFIFLALLAFVALGKNVIFLLAMQRPTSPYFALFIIILLLLSVYLLAMIDTILLARSYADKFQPKKYNKWFVYAIVIALAWFIIRPIGLHYFLVQAYIIPSDAMMPTINNGDGILVDNFTYKSNKPCRGDVVVVKLPENQRIKHVRRIIGLPGETIEIKDKRVYINDEQLREKYVVYHDLVGEIAKVYQFRDNLPPAAIPQGYYFVMGDNRDYSSDSRLWGVLDGKLIEGEVKVIYLSGGEITWEKIGKPPFQR